MTTKILWWGIVAVSVFFVYLWVTRKPAIVQGQAGAVAGLRG